MVKEFTADAMELSKHIRWISQGVNKLNNSQYVLLKVNSDSTIELSSFNHVNSYKGRMDITALDGDPGEFVLDGEFLTKTTRILKGDTVKISFTKKDMTIQTKISVIKVPIMSNVKLPRLPAMPSEIGTVVAEDFSRAVKQVSRAASGELEKNLMILTCVNIEFDPSESVIRLTATARYYLSHKIIPYTPVDPRSHKFNLSINAKSLDQAVRDMIEGDVLTIHAESGDMKKFGISSSDKTVYLGVTDAEYAKYEPLLNTKTEDSTALITTGELSKHLGDVIALNADERVSIQFKKDSAELQGSNTKINVGVQYKGEDKLVSFKSDHLKKAVDFISSKKMKLFFPVNPRQGVILREVDEKGEVDSSFLGLVSPTM